MFSNIVGNDIFKKVFNGGELRNGYIFEGIDGIGKKTMAMEIAKVYSGGIIQNVHVIDKDSISIDDIREVCDSIQVFPYMNKKRIIVINNAEKMNDVSQNTLLKTLENPPINCHFFLITNSIDKLLDTIISRCIICRFKRIDNKVIQDIITNELKIKSDLKDFLSICVAGRIGKLFDIKNDDSKLSYYKDLFSIAEDLSNSKDEKKLLSISEMFGSDDILSKLNDLMLWFSYLYIVNKNAEYFKYHSIIKETIDNINRGGNSSLSVELMIIRILRYNFINKKSGGNKNEK